MDCKKALTEANGDFEEAVVILRKKGQKVSASRADRQANEGIVVALTNDAQTRGLLLELNCETDFVAKNEDFTSLARKLAEHCMAHGLGSAEALLPTTMDGAVVSDLLVEYTGKIGEKIGVNRVEVLEGEGIVTYIHSNGKLGVLVSLNQGLNGDVTLDDVDPSLIEKEIEIGKDQARAEGKPEAILEKIAMGKLNKFYQDQTLLNQAFVKDNAVTIAQMLQKVQAGLTVKAFHRVSIGA